MPGLALALTSITATASPLLAHADTAERIIHVTIAGRVVTVADTIDGSRPGGSCTLHVDGQALPTYGHGELEAYRCDGMADAGPLTRRHGRDRIVAIYDVGGSPGVGFRTAIVIESDGATWRIDDDSIGVSDDKRHARSARAFRRWDDAARHDAR